MCKGYRKYLKKVILSHVLFMPFYAFFSLRLSTFWEGFISSQRIEVSAPLSLIGKSAPRDYILFFRPYFKDNINKFNVSFICDLNLSSFLGGVTDCEYLRYCNFCQVTETGPYPLSAVRCED